MVNTRNWFVMCKNKEPLRTKFYRTINRGQLFVRNGKEAMKFIYKNAKPSYSLHVQTLPDRQHSYSSYFHASGQ